MSIIETSQDKAAPSLLSESSTNGPKGSIGCLNSHKDDVFIFKRLAVLGERTFRFWYSKYFRHYQKLHF